MKKDFQTVTRLRPKLRTLAPIHKPVDARGNPLYKVTIAPTPPRALRTNTHSRG